MTGQRLARIERVLAGVLRQACLDAGVRRLSVAGTGADADLARAICAQAVGPNNVGEGGLTVDPAAKTGLLLGAVPQADVLLFGDLYYSQVVELAGAAALPPVVARLAAACGGPEALDRALYRFFDQRLDWPAAAGELDKDARELLESAVEGARFSRTRIGMVPKLGARTLGIDLYA